MSEHDHDDCQHELAYCEQHDVAYCGKCDEEWSGPCQLQHEPAFYWWNQPYYGTSTVSSPPDVTTYVTYPDTTSNVTVHTEC